MSKAYRAIRPATLARRFTPNNLSCRRAGICTTASRFSGPKPPSLFGPGIKAGQVPTDFDQATGMERLQLLGEMEGVAVFDHTPLDSSRVGTMKDPVLVPSLDVERIVGCTGSPADSHDLLWFNVHKDKTTRCGECGSVYAIDFQGSEDHHEHAHH